MAEYGQFCPVAKATDIVGERWTVLILRELLLGTTRYNDFLRGLSRLSPTLLSKRLKTLEEQMLEAPDRQLSLTDPDSRSMKTRGAGIVGYNTQIVLCLPPETAITIFSNSGENTVFELASYSYLGSNSARFSSSH